MSTTAHKYHAKPTTVDGIRFHSQKEAKRYGELKLLEKAGVIRGLTLQPRFVLYAKPADRGESEPIGAYRGDFSYERAYCVTFQGVRRECWRGVVEDVKGFKTPLYKWKKKHVEIQYGITIVEI